MVVSVVVLSTSDGDFDVGVYQDPSKAKKVIKEELKRIEGNDRYDIMESGSTRLTYIDQEDDVVVEYKYQLCDVE